MGLDDITEKVSDAGIEKAGDAVEDKTGGKGAAQVENAEKVADSRIGE